MKVLIGCDVDPNLPAILRRPPHTNIWQTLDQIENLVATVGDVLPPITWLIRSDESVRFCTGSYASGFTSRQVLWRSLMDRGHELGWHMHHFSFDERRGVFGFDPNPSWLSDAHNSLAKHFQIRATRIGWDYGSTGLFNSLDKLGIQIDFSALPGNIAWHWAGHDRVVVDWRRCQPVPYHPDRHDYQAAGPSPLQLLEVPITQFSNSVLGMAKRCVWRLVNRCCSVVGIRNKTPKMTDPWKTPALPHSDRCSVHAFFFHPSELTENGISHFIRNVNRLRLLPDANFVTASQIGQTTHPHL
jgi:hypothetical protein